MLSFGFFQVSIVSVDFLRGSLASVHPSVRPDSRPPVLASPASESEAAWWRGSRCTCSPALTEVRREEGGSERAALRSRSLVQPVLLHRPKPDGGSGVLRLLLLSVVNSLSLPLLSLLPSVTDLNSPLLEVCLLLTLAQGSVIRGRRCARQRFSRGHSPVLLTCGRGRGRGGGGGPGRDGTATVHSQPSNVTEGCGGGGVLESLDGSRPARQRGSPNFFFLFFCSFFPLASCVCFCGHCVGRGVFLFPSLFPGFKSYVALSTNLL